MDSKLEKHVREWVEDVAGDSYDGDKDAVIKDLMYGGCESGMVGHLVYYADTTAFYAEHKAEINALLCELLEDTGYSPAGLFGDKWDTADPLALEQENQNLLAWFGFEETAQRLFDC